MQLEKKATEIKNIENSCANFELPIDILVEAISKLPFSYLSKPVFVQTHLYGNVFHLHVSDMFIFLQIILVFI